MRRCKSLLGPAIGGVLLFAAWGFAAENRDEVLKARQAVLERIEKLPGQRQNLSPSDGLFEKMMVESTKAKRILEIGSSNGCSAIWLGWGLEQTGGHLWTIEIDAQRAREARENLKQAGLLDSAVTVIEGDAFKEIPKLEGTFDLISLDAWKEDYDEFFQLFFPRLNEGGVIIAHNAIQRAEDMKEYLNLVTTHPELDTVLVKTTSNPTEFKAQLEDARERRAFDGFAVSYRRMKKRP